ncbi:MAG: STAS domain-containing protein [Bacteroidota bacterium]|jgi:rsbT co-antagonist protein RsbR|nr:STAS domain-containing protein [Ignavibacteria bacterium]MCU7522310.1 STAS domain-containing protein [Ignavibacteria bacterium]MCU7525561.1 STAS domain-containing protein [Ignavibacteria bacterium]HEX2961351.1 STAS domain-containing protein [Ignavibacteriales bacterium]
MAKEQVQIISDILNKKENEILNSWVKEQLQSITFRSDLMNENELRQQSGEFLNLFREAAAQGMNYDIYSPIWSRVLEMLGSVSRSRAIQGYSPSETATFIFSLKQPLFNSLTDAVTDDPKVLSREIWNITVIFDKLGLYTVEMYIKSREEIILRQQREMIELSTPVVQLWNGILALPLIGTLDSERTQVVMESLLTKIVESGSYVAIIDITGVPTVDTLVAQHLLKTVAAAKLMGAECIISGIRPQIAQTIVHLGVNLEDVTTKATMAEALRSALVKNGLHIVKAQANQKKEQ